MERTFILTIMGVVILTLSKKDLERNLSKIIRASEINTKNNIKC
jgi:hypothetical protein